MRSRFIVLFAVLGSMGCRQAIVESNLPIRRVVVYRNGVAYFERAGHVEEDTVKFKMKQTEVGDFLATLAVMEQGGSSVRSAAFPLKVDKDNTEAKKKTPPTEDEKRGLRTVVLSLDGQAHDLQVGYVAESPVWRPSYRLVVEADGHSDLQAWGIVQNLSGEDWKDVSLSLVAGAPISFQAQLGTPVIPGRPIVTDQGEVIASVPTSDTSLGQDEDKSAQGQPPPPAPPPPPAAAPATEGEFGNNNGPGGAVAGLSAGAPAPKAAEPSPNDARGHASTGFVQPSAPRNVASLAAVAVEGGTTRYDLPNTVTVPDKSATMVLLLSQRVAGEAIYLFSPDDGVPDSASHPFRVARYLNSTPGVLERGPIAVFEHGNFLGQGMVDPLPAGATATVPFALERAIGVDRESKYDEVGARLAKIENGQLFIERDAVTKTIYHLKNGLADDGSPVAPGQPKHVGPVKIMVKHPRQNGTRLYQPPAGTEDNVGTGSALVPALVMPHTTFNLTVDERATFQRGEDWFSDAADNAVKAYLKDPRANQEIVQKLTAAWVLRTQLVDKMHQAQAIQTELATLAQEASEKRQDLRAIEKNTAADALRKTLTQRLADIAARQDVLQAQNIQLGQDLGALRINFRDAIRAINLTEPLPPRP
jgi:hypothetical protein